MKKFNSTQTYLEMLQDWISNGENPPPRLPGLMIKILIQIIIADDVVKKEFLAFEAIDILTSN
jgi:hypothetical protein